MRAFTPRGVGLLCAGGTILLGGLVLGEYDLVGLGVLLAALPGLGALTLLGAFRGLLHGRALEPTRIPAGGEVRVGLRLANTRTVLPVAGALAEDALPPGLGAPPRFPIGLLGPQRSRDLTYRIAAPTRGHYPVGPLHVTVGDPLGCIRATRALGGTMGLLVTPRIADLTGEAGAAGAAELGEIPVRAMAAAGEYDPVPRAYRYGDDLRRVHWRSTARTGELMVRREEARHDGGATLLVDVRTAAHSGSGAASTLETAVSAAASVAVHMAGRGRRVRLLTGDGEAAPPGTGREALMEALAMLPASPSADLTHGAGLIGGRPGGTGPVVAVLGDVSPGDLTVLGAPAAGTADRRIAILCTARADASAAALSDAGWSTITITDVSELTPAWSALSMGLDRPGTT